MTFLHIHSFFTAIWACCMVWVSHLLKILLRPLDICSWFLSEMGCSFLDITPYSFLFSGPFRACCMVWTSHLLKIFWRPLDICSWLVYFRRYLSPWPYSISILFSRPFGLAAWCGFPLVEDLVATPRYMFLIGLFWR